MTLAAALDMTWRDQVPAAYSAAALRGRPGPFRGAMVGSGAFFLPRPIDFASVERFSA
jgi:hypothetical protein